MDWLPSKTVPNFFRQRKVILCLVLVLLDLLSKLGAYIFLSLDSSITMWGNFNLRVLVNNTGSNAVFSMFGDKATATILAGAATYGLLGLLFFVLQKSTASKRIRVYSYIGFIILALGSFLLFRPDSIPFKVNSYLLGLIRLVPATLTYLVFLLFTRDKIFILAWLLIFSGGLSNLLSNFYPPFSVIDFVSFTLGETTPKALIFNFADVYIASGWLVIPVAILMTLFRSTKKRGVIQQAPQSE